MISSLQNLRRSYSQRTFDVTDALDNPFEQFAAWFTQAQEAEILEPNAMTLATADANGKPSARIVLLKHIDLHGLVWYTNYQSHKGSDIKANPFAALLFFWGELERQIRIEGRVEVVSQKESAEYFRSRPADSQRGAWASAQSSLVSTRQELEQRFANVLERYPDDANIPLPEFWGGYRLIPTRFEFWQGRANRLHDRIVYIIGNTDANQSTISSHSNNQWLKQRLMP